LDCPCEELVRTLREAARGEVYLPPEVSNMLAHDETRPEHKRERIWDLSPRELQIVQLISEGLSSREVAARLHISPKTVENHRYNIYRKCDVDNVSGLIRHAFSRGLVEI
jgi:DNA-binding NarL/FixJ family response regulator